MISYEYKKLKIAFECKERHPLPNVICEDLCKFFKLQLCLFICILVTAVIIITTAHKTRLLTAKREQLVLERSALDIEWRNLIIEEKALGAHSRVEQIATEKLKMQHINRSNERIVVIPQ